MVKPVRVNVSRHDARVDGGATRRFYEVLERRGLTNTDATCASESASSDLARAIRQQGIDPIEAAERVRSVLKGAVARFEGQVLEKGKTEPEGRPPERVRDVLLDAIARYESAHTRQWASGTWDCVLDRLKSRLNTHSFNTWLRPTEAVAEGDALVRVRVPNLWFAEWLRTNYLSHIQDALQEMERPNLAVEFVTPEEGDQTRGNASAGSHSDTASFVWTTATSLNPRYTFEKFVVSSYNQFAHAAAVAVAEQPARAYNPLYIYGGDGLGKTHLMQAIGQRVAERGVARMRYITTEQFLNELINAIRFERTLEFKEQYRTVDVLLIDDIQFLAGKERTQEEFFDTFNALYDAQKQIVITSDCLPREIPALTERLRFRFELGLIAELQPPDLETKIAILRQKARAEDTVLPDDVALFIATHSKSNIRELEGALIRAIAYASLSGRGLSLEMAKDTLKDHLAPKSPAVTVETIQNRVANYFKLRVTDLESKTDSQQIAFPRQISMFLCKKMTNCTVPEIGKRFGGKHHSTVIHAIQRIDDVRRRNKDVDRLLEYLEQSLR